MSKAYHVAMASRTLKSWETLARKELDKVLEAAYGLRELRPLVPAKQPWHAELDLASGPKMKALNKTFRGKDYATDVLSFPSPAPLKKLGVLGEIVVCLPVLKRQAKEQKHSAEIELKILLVHGVLHLLGMDHEKSPKEAAKMQKAEDKVLKKKGLIARAGKVIKRT